MAARRRKICGMAAIDPMQPMKKTDGMDWEQGRWTKARAPAAAAEIVIAADWAPIRAFAPVIASAPEAVYGDVLDELRQCDLRIVNLECPLITRGTPVSKSGSVLPGRAECVKGLTAVPFEVATLANNHVFDYGVAGFQETIQRLQAHAIHTVGAGMSADEAGRPLWLKVKGINLAVINFSEGEDLTAAEHGPGVCGWNIAAVAERVRAVRPTADLVLAIGHCGLEYIPFPPPYVARAFERIAEAGADLVIGHHPHVPQGVQIHRNTPICYSLGNFVFYQETDLAYRKIGYLVKAGIAGKSLSSIQIIPYAILADRLSLLRGDKRAHFFKTLRRISRPLQEDGGVEAAWRGFLRYYGVQGFQAEVRTIMDRLAAEPAKGAAMFRNRLTTMQHREHWQSVLTRIMEGTLDDAPEWACDLAREWLTATR